MSKTIEEQTQEQVVLNLQKICEIAIDSKTALNMLAILYDVELGSDE